MKVLKIVIIVVAIISCGKNAYLDDKDKPERVIMTPPVTGEFCDKVETVNLLPEFDRRSNHSDIPFYFDEKILNEYSYTVILQGVPRKILFNAQLVLPFSFDSLRSIEGEILKMELVYSGERVYDTTWHHEPQFCQSHLKTCSGNYHSIDDHVRPTTGYTWNNLDYGNFVDGLDWIDLGEDYREQNLNIRWDLLRYFQEPAFYNLPADYLVTIADHQLIKDARIVVKYCSY
jgi:hypothetical protein